MQDSRSNGKGHRPAIQKSIPCKLQKMREACKNDQLETGKFLVVKDSNLLSDEKTINYFPTK